MHAGTLEVDPVRPELVAPFVPFLYEGPPDIPPEMTLDDYRRARFAGRPTARRGIARLGLRRQPR
jgi:hypothetical protein